MKKRQLLKMAFAVMFLAVLASCKKDDVNLLSATDNEVAKIESVSSNENEGLRGVDPSGKLNAVMLEYGDSYVFSDMATAPVYTTDNSTIYVYVAPFFLDYNNWISIVISNSGQLIGLYEFDFDDYKSDNYNYSESNNEIDVRSNYHYYVKDIDDVTITLFDGGVLANIYGLPEYLYVYPSYLPLPSNYPYPLFDNVVNGTYNLGTIGTLSPCNAPEKARIAIRAALTFYNYFY